MTQTKGEIRFVRPGRILVDGVEVAANLEVKFPSVRAAPGRVLSMLKDIAPTNEVDVLAETDGAWWSVSWEDDRHQVELKFLEKKR